MAKGSSTAWTTDLMQPMGNDTHSREESHDPNVAWKGQIRNGLRHHDESKKTVKLLFILIDSKYDQCAYGLRFDSSLQHFLPSLGIEEHSPGCRMHAGRQAGEAGIHVLIILIIVLIIVLLIIVIDGVISGQHSQSRSVRRRIVPRSYR